MSRFGLICSALFVLFSTTGRLLYPYTDEPDWGYRVDQVLASRNAVSPYFWVRKVIEHDRIATQAVEYPENKANLWTKVHAVCIEPAQLTIARLMSTIIITAPILGVITFRRQCYKMLRVCRCKIRRNELNKRLDALGISLLFPGAIYYLGVLAYEQFTVVFGMMLLVVWGLIMPVLLCIAFISLIDLGSALVVSLFCVVLMVFSRLMKHFTASVVVWLIVLCASLAWFCRDMLIANLSVISLIAGQESAVGAKAEAMRLAFSDGVIANKYPLIVRPFITLMSSVLLTPSGIKSLASYLMLAGFMCLFVVQKHSHLLKSWFSPQLILAPIFLILLLVTVFPAYANAKYYVFTLPFITLYLTQFYPRNKVLLAYSLLTFCTYISLFASYI